MKIIKKHMTETEYQESKTYWFQDTLIGAAVTIMIALGALYTGNIVMMCIAGFFAFFEAETILGYFTLCRSHDKLCHKNTA